MSQFILPLADELVVDLFAGGGGGGADEDYLYTLECVPENFPTQGSMAVIRANPDPK